MRRAPGEQTKRTAVENGFLICGEGRIPYRIVKSARRTMAVSVTREGEAVIRIPARASFDCGRRLAEEYREWIFSHVEKCRSRRREYGDFCWQDGARLDLAGGVRELKIVKDGSVKAVQAEGRRILVPDGGDGEVKRAVMDWYREQAAARLRDRTVFWADRMGVDFGRITIRSQSSRWGSCSAKGNLSYNWRLILLPEELCDYVVVHELAHRKEMNHSRRFWKLVEQELPDCEQRRRQLRDYEDYIYTKYQD